jgi:hypothetical protein
VVAPPLRGISGRGFKSSIAVVAEHEGLGGATFHALDDLADCSSVVLTKAAIRLLGLAAAGGRLIGSESDRIA